MERSIPVWLVLFFFLLWLIFTLVFGWAIRSTVLGSERSGAFGQAAVAVAAFPNQAKTALTAARSYATGDFADEAIGVRRDRGVDYSGFAPAGSATGSDIPGVILRATPDQVAPGWRYLVGAFTIDGEIENAALLLSPDLEIAHIWTLDEVPVGEEQPRPKHRKFPHGAEILPDGSIIYTFDGSISLQRIDACSSLTWSVGGKYHHAVAHLADDDTVWSLIGMDALRQVDAKTGQTLRTITMPKVIDANPLIDIFEIRMDYADGANANQRNTDGEWTGEAYHFNDVDPLPARLAAQFPQFEPGDLLLSARELNLVFVLDPDTLEVKWWRIGEMQRQHDPDWGEDGQIIIYNNRMGRDFSQIIAIDPKSFDKSVLFDGQENDFYSRIRGKQQVLEDGRMIIASSQQGRVFEVNPDGSIPFELINTKPGSDDTNYPISEMRWLPPDYFNADIFDKEARPCPSR